MSTQTAPPTVPMQKVIAFALFSTRRQEEITLLRWDDLDGDWIFVRDMKHPGDKIGNNVYCELPPEALIGHSVNAAQRRDGIFPFSTDAISASFTRACKFWESRICAFTTFDTKEFPDFSKWEERSHRRRQYPDIAAGRAFKRYTHIRQTGDKLPIGNGSHLSACKLLGVG